MKKLLNKRKNILIVLIILLAVIVLLSISISFLKLKGEVSVYHNGDDNLSIEIDNYNKENGIVYRDVLQVIINAKFKSDTSTGKKVKISLAEGMTYDAYFVKEKDENNIFQKQMLEEEDLYKAVSSVDTPIITSTGLTTEGVQYYSYGDLLYNIYDNIISVSIAINIKADAFRYYDEKTIKDALKISLYEDENEISSLKEDIKLLNDSSFKIYARNINYYSSKSVFTSTEQKKWYGTTDMTYLNKVYQLDGNAPGVGFTPYYKKMEYHLYYPEETEFYGIVGSQNKDMTDEINFLKTNGIASYEVNNDENKIIITFNEYYYSYYGFGVKYKTGKTILENGIASNKERNKIVVTFYDDEKREFVQEDGKIYSVNVLDSSTFENKIIKEVSNHFDDSDNDTFTFGPMFRIINTTPGEKTMQTLEFEFDDNYQVVAANFPISSSSKIIKIQYKTNKSNGDWIDYKKELKSYISKYNAGYVKDDGVYFTAIRAVVDVYPEGYETGVAAAKSQDNAVLYGNLYTMNVTSSATNKKNTKVCDNLSDKDKTNLEKIGISNPSNSLDVACVTLHSYSGNSKDDYEENSYNKTTGYIRRITENETLETSGTNTVKYFSFDKSTVNAGETFTMNATFAIHSYPYGNVSYMKNPEIYIRQPFGVSINTSNIELLDNNNANVPFTITKKINKFNETIYILKTNYTVGHYFSEQLLNKKLTINVPVKVNLDTKLISLKMTDVLTWGNNNYVPTGYNIVKDIYDFDGDDIYYDETDSSTKNEMIIGTSPVQISILPSKSVIATTYVEKNGIQSLPYDEENINTIVDIKKNDKFDYIVKIKNNTTTDVNNFVMYIPVPKKDNNFIGIENYIFNWDMTLSSPIKLPSGFKVLYSTENNKEISKIKYYEKLPEDLNDITAIKIMLEDVIDKEEEITFNIPYMLKETRKNAQNYHNKINVWYPIYTMSTSALSGTFNGTSVGLRLLANEISGKVFYDNNANGVFDNGIDKSTSDINVSLYKLNNDDNYVFIDTMVKFDMKVKEFYIDEYDFSDDEVYALKFDIPKDYYITTGTDNWIKGITTKNSFNKNIGIVTYDLDFDVNNYILAKNEETQLYIKNIKPVFFDNIKGSELAYKWEIVNEEDNNFIKLESDNKPYAYVKALEEKDIVKIRVSIFDKYGNFKTKEFNIRIKSNMDPTLYIDDVTIDIGNKIEFEKYVKNALNYKEEKIELKWSGNDKNITYEHNIPNALGYASKAGAYYITYYLEDEYGKTNKTIKLIVDDKFNIKNPSTKDTLSKILLLLFGFITITIIIIYKIRR